MSEFLPLEVAVGMITENKYVHTFRQGGMIIIGADWERDDLISAMEKHGVQLAGEQATQMGHGLCLKDDRGFLFIETKKS